MNKIKFYIGVDGGGTGTRLKVIDSNGSIVAEGSGPESALSLGIKKSWDAILFILNEIAKDIKFSECYLGAGISGINNSIWKKEFLEANPGFAKVIAKPDGYTTLLGAHKNKPGIIIALGTGSIGMCKDSHGAIQSVSGWGYPSGDEASASWLGIQCVRYTQKVLDGRVKASPLTNLVQDICGKNANDFLNWLGKATQTNYASLAPLVFSVSASDEYAKELIAKAIEDIEEMIFALDRNEKLPVVMCGKLGEHFLNYLPEHLLNRCIPAMGSSVDGALMLLKKSN